MPRNLLPRLRRAPNPANIPQVRVGSWTDLLVPSDLAKLDYGNVAAGPIRTRLQSVPNPWARFLLFKNALEDSGHPARKLVENEILDGLEFLWGAAGLAGSQFSLSKIRIADIRAQGSGVGSKRVEDLADAFAELLPRRNNGPALNSPAFDSVTVATVRGRPVLASSPYSLLVTSEDAAGEGTGDYFQFRKTGVSRPLTDRPQGFQRYVARVLLPQLQLQTTADPVTFDWRLLRELVSAWLTLEVAKTPFGIGVEWLREAEVLHLKSIDPPMAGVQLFLRESGADLDESAWRLRSSRLRPGDQAPLVLDRTKFNGTYYEGASTVTLPTDLSRADRAVLPVSNVRHPWVEPNLDWFTDQILFFDVPLEKENVFGFDNWLSHYQGPDERKRQRSMALPLKEAFFQFFSPEDLGQMLHVTVGNAGSVEVTLTVPIGSASDGKTLTIKRQYDDAHQHLTNGPALTLWPKFRDDRWNNYVLFRHDRNAQTAGLFQVSASENGLALTSDRERRTTVIEALAFSRPPEVITIRSRDLQSELGVVLPRLSAPNAHVQSALLIGVDFGTSNTVISLREEGATAPSILASSDIVLPLTQLNDTENRFLNAYFFPRAIEAKPFGTAVVHVRRLNNFQLERQKTGVRVTVPFQGAVKPDENNSVVGDLKWSSDQAASFLTASFLRHILSVVMSYALEHGYDPSRLSIAYAFPRSFTPTQQTQLRSLWDKVVTSIRESGIPLEPAKPPIDESSAMLRHFYNAGVVTLAGTTTALLDVGGGTSDIAIYRDDRALVLDSIVLGGRNLTGARLRANTGDQLRNPFVARFAKWAGENGLRNEEVESDAVGKYLSDAQDHLAFTYLLGTNWYEKNGDRFTGTEDFQHFQILVLYFFGSLFYYLGLSVRDSGAVSGSELPRQVVLGGFGSRYMNWLTGGFVDVGTTAFNEVFSALVRAGAGIDSAESLRISMSREPKREVALGLAAKVNPGLVEGDAKTTSVVGESVQLTGRAEAFQSADRFDAQDIFQATDVAGLRWADGPMELERFHNAMLGQKGVLAGFGSQWNGSMKWLAEFLAQRTSTDFQTLARNRMHYLAQSGDGYRGSVFSLEIAAMLDLLSDALFPM